MSKQNKVERKHYNMRSRIFARVMIKTFSIFQYGKVIDSIWVVKEKHGFSAWF